MAFHEVKRYHIECDTPNCNTVYGYVEYDLNGRPTNFFALEIFDAVIEKITIDELHSNNWLVVDNKVYCPVCSIFVSNAVMFTLKASMGY